MSLSRTFDILTHQLAHSSAKHVVSSRQAGQWIRYTSQEFYDASLQYSGLLFEMGLRKGDKLIIIPKAATAEWVLFDLAAQQMGVIVVTAHATLQPPQFQHIVTEAQPAFCLVHDEELWLQIQSPATSHLNVLILHGPTSHPENLPALLQQASPIDSEYLTTVSQAIHPNDLSAIIYTSGTTGEPKGVMLSHGNIMSNVTTLLPLMPLTDRNRVISFLPYSHVFERTVIYCYLAMGCQVHLMEDQKDIRSVFIEVRPHFFSAVPRILEKMYEEVVAYQSRQKWLLKTLLGWALQVGARYRKGGRFHLVQWIKKQLAKQIIFARFRKRMGGNVKAIAVGAAHLRPELGRFFHFAGIRVLEGYGMTETSPVVSINRFQPGLQRYGTVGLPLPGVKVKIHEPNEDGEGEIWVKGPNVMQGYFQQPKTTEKVLTDGWLHTGDVGKFVHKRFLQITDRKKDIFKTSSGKYVAPALLEQHFRNSIFVNQVMVIGFQRPFVTALIYPNYEQLEHWATEQGIHWTHPAYMALNIKVREKIQAELQPLQEAVARHERIREFYLVAEEWTVESGYLTLTNKLVRAKIMADFAKAIEGMYEG